MPLQHADTAVFNNAFYIFQIAVKIMKELRVLIKKYLIF